MKAWFVKIHCLFLYLYTDFVIEYISSIVKQISN